MKLIDKKGRLFGKINVVDLLALVVLVAAAALLAVKLLTPAEEEETASALLTYTVRVVNVEKVTYDNICQFVDREKGLKDQVLAGDELQDAYIVDVTATEHLGSQLERVTEGALDLLFTIEAEVTDPQQNLVGTQEVRAGKSHIVKTQHMEFSGGVVMTCEWSPLEGE